MRRRDAILLLCLTACSAVPPSVPNATPEPSKREPGFSETTLEADDGVSLYARAWSPEALRADVVIVHGLRDHGDRYAALARALNQRGIAVHAMDLRGHGRSGGPRVTVDSLERYVDDLERFVHRVQDSGRPLFLFGHSMGGAIAARYVERPGHAVAGLVLSAPALSLFVSDLEVCGVNLVHDLDPNAPLLDIDMQKWSQRPEVVSANERDPWVYQPAAPVRTAVALIEGAAEAQREAPFVRVPLLVMHGGADGITDPAGSRRFVALARSSDKTLRVYPGLYHDLWNEPEHAKLALDLAEWLSAHLPAREAAASADL